MGAELARRLVPPLWQSTIHDARSTARCSNSELLAEVYIELIGGKQAALVLDVQEAGDDDRETTSSWSVTADYRRH